MNPAWYILFAFLLCAALGEPLFVALFTVALLAFSIISGIAPEAAGTRAILSSFHELTHSEVLIAIPLFTLAGTIMTHGGISPRLIAVARAALGFLPGGLAIACVFACTFFAAISGSSSVTIIAIGGILYPALVKAGYGERFSLGLITICGAIGTLIPPSLPLIVYGVIAGNSVTEAKPRINDLFIAGIGPSLLGVTLLCAYGAGFALVRRIPRSPFSLGELLAAVRSGAFALVMPALLLTLIYGGFATVHETSAMAVLYALFVEMVVHRAVKPRDLIPIVLETMTLVGSILIILVAANALVGFLKDQQVPDYCVDVMRYDRAYDASEFETYVGTIVKDVPGEPLVIAPKDDPESPHEIPRESLGWVARPLVQSRTGFLVGVNVLLLAVGCIMDIFSGTIVLAPLVVPMARAYDVDLVHLGMIFAFNLELGFVTPPFGINLFISQSFFRRSVHDVVKSCAPFFLLLILGLVLVTWVPEISLLLLGGRP